MKNIWRMFLATGIVLLAAGTISTAATIDKDPWKEYIRIEGLKLADHYTTNTLILQDSTIEIRVVASDADLSIPTDPSPRRLYRMTPGAEAYVTVDVQDLAYHPVPSYAGMGFAQWTTSDDNVKVYPTQGGEYGALIKAGDSVGSTSRVYLTLTIPTDSATEGSSIVLFWQMRTPAYMECNRLSVPSFLIARGNSVTFVPQDFEDQRVTMDCWAMPPAPPPAPTFAMVIQGESTVEQWPRITVRVVDTMGDPVVGETPSFTVLTGGWAGGVATATRACTTDGLGICSPGQVSTGTTLRISLPDGKAEDVEITASGA